MVNVKYLSCRGREISIQGRPWRLSTLCWRLLAVVCKTFLEIQHSSSLQEVQQPLKPPYAKGDREILAMSLSINKIVEALLSLQSSGRLNDAWWTNDAVARALHVIEGYVITPKQLNHAVSRDQGILCFVDNLGVGFNQSKITRNKRKVKGVVRYFYFFSSNKPAILPRTTKEWCKVVERPLPRLSPRRIVNVDATQPGAMSDNTAMVEGTPNVRKRPRIEPITPPTPPNESLPVISTPTFHVGVWHDNKTRTLFGIRDDEDDVRDTLMSIIDIMMEALTDVSLVLTTPHETMAEELLPDSTLLHICSKVRILRLAYIVALDHYGVDGWSWRRCCVFAMDTLAKIGEHTYAVSTVMKWNRRFQRTRTWVHPYESIRRYKPWFFRNFPGAKSIARRHLSSDLRELCVEKATEYFRGEFLDKVIEMEYESEKIFDEAMRTQARESLLQESKLKTISPATACRWLAYLGYKYGAHRRVYYTDEHERDDNKADRVAYAKTLAKNEIRKYCWVRLTAEQKQMLESLDKDPLERDAHARTYNNGTLFEYHISRHPCLIEFVSDDNQQHGGDLSREMLRMPGMRPIIEVGQDKAVFQQYAQSAMEWRGPNGESTPRPKSDGDAIMISAFIGPSIGFGRNTDVSNEALQRINNIRNARPTYHDTYAAEEVYGTIQKRPFSNEDEVRQTLCITFEHGKNREGYWNNAHMTVQTEDAIDILQGLFPNHDIELHYDQSLGHTKKRHFGLNVEVMNKSFGGATPEMRDTIMTQGCLGPFQHENKLKVGQTQSMAFKEDDLGPWELSAEERVAQKHDRATGDKKTEVKRKKQLMEELGMTNRGTRIDKLKEEAVRRGIPLTFEVDNIKKGWVGASKGMLQVLWERGWIDPGKSPSYYKAAVPKGWKDNHGNLKPQNIERANQRVLPIMLRQCEDFVNEITAMEELCNLLSTSSSNVIILFSPKYHCELAGCGVELAWGFAKRYYRRKMIFKEKKNFKDSVDRSLQVVSKAHCRRFLNRVRRYAEAYLCFHENGKDTTYDLIEKFVKVSKTHRSALDQEFGFLTREVDELT